MERIDFAIVVLAVVAVGGSVAGLLTYEGGGLKTYVMEFEEHRLAAEEDSGSISGAGDAELTFQIDQANITRSEITVWVNTTDPILTDRNVNLTVEAPNGSTGYDTTSISSDVQGAQASVSTTVPVSEVPANHEEQATSADEVHRQAIRDHGHAMETGEWTATVTIMGGDVQDPAEFSLEGNLVVHYFDVHVSQRTPDIQR